MSWCIGQSETGGIQERLYLNRRCPQCHTKNDRLRKQNVQRVMKKAELKRMVTLTNPAKTQMQTDNKISTQKGKRFKPAIASVSAQLIQNNLKESMTEKMDICDDSNSSYDSFSSGYTSLEEILPEIMQKLSLDFEEDDLSINMDNVNYYCDYDYGIEFEELGRKHKLRTEEEDERQRMKDRAELNLRLGFPPSSTSTVSKFNLNPSSFQHNIGTTEMKLNSNKTERKGSVRTSRGTKNSFRRTKEVALAKTIECRSTSRENDLRQNPEEDSTITSQRDAKRRR